MRPKSDWCLKPSGHAKTIEINKLPGQVALNLGGATRQQQAAWPCRGIAEVTYVRPKVLVDARAVAAYAKVCGFKQAHGVPLLFPTCWRSPCR